MEEAATLLEYSYLDNNQGLPPIDFAMKQVMSGAPVLQLDSGVLVACRCYIPDPVGSRYILFLLYSYLLYFTHSPEDPIGSDDPHSLLFFHYCFYNSMTHGSMIFRFPLVFTFMVILLLRLLSYYLRLLSLVHKYSHLLYCSIKGVQTVVVRLKSKINLAGLITPFAHSSPLQRL